MTEETKTRASAGPRPGSLTWTLQRLEPGEFCLLPVPADRTLTTFMQYVSSGISRVSEKGQMQQSVVLGVEIATRKVIEIVKVARAPAAPVKVTRAKRSAKA